MIVVTFALPVESSKLVALLQEKTRASSGDIEIIRGNVGNRPIGIFYTGVGTKTCAKRIDNFLRVAQPKYLISSGFAGAVREDLRVGDLILAENFSDRQLLSTAHQVLRDQSVHSAKLFTSPTMIDSAFARSEVARTQGAAAVDMETECIAQACLAREVRMLSLRSISDTPRESFPAPPDVLFDIDRQRTNKQKLSLYLLNHPGAVWRLIRFARQIGKARDALTAAVVALLGSNEW